MRNDEWRKLEVALRILVPETPFKVWVERVRRYCVAVASGGVLTLGAERLIQQLL